MGEITRRRFLQVSATAAAALATRPGGLALAHPAPHDFARRFQQPARDVQSKFRWWWPHGLVDPVEIEREIDQIAAAGFGGVEIADVHHSVAAPLDPAGHGWGTPAWVTALEAALRRAKKRGLTVDITIGPAWPAAVPSITPDDPGAMQELAYGILEVAGGGTYDGPVPAAKVAPSDGVTRQDLLRVQAVRVIAPAPAPRRPATLDGGSLQDLTAAVHDGRVTWTAPAGDAQWAILSYWERGTGQQPEAGPHTDPPSYVVDHFGRAGTQAVIDFWERHILNSRVRGLLRDVGGALFEDSIELETDATLWTPGFLEAFERQAGYSLLPYLPLVVEDNEKTILDYDDAQVTKRVRRDYWDVMTQLYLDEHLEPVQSWGHSIGMQLRIQPYGLQTDAIAAAGAVDIPEGESLGFRNNDDFRCLAGGRDMAGNKILSDEAGATAGGAYSTTWDATLRKLGGQWAAGVNQTVFHGFSYATVPGAKWPGFAAFTPYHGTIGYGESWGPRDPTWRHVADVAGYLARTQQILQSGTNRVDAALLWERGYAGTGFSAPWFVPTGMALGWSHQMISPRLLDLPSAKVARGRLAPDGPAYKVLIVEGDAFAGREHVLQLATARRLLEYAKAGLPIVFVGTWSDAHAPNLPKPGEDERLQALVDELLALSTVVSVADRPSIGNGLAALDIRRDAEYAQSSPLVNVHRAAKEVDYYYLWNGSSDAVADHDVTFAAPGRQALPYRLDAWTGAVERIAAYDWAGDRLRTRITLGPGQTTIVAIGRPGWHHERGGRGLHAISTDADGVRYRGRDLVVRDTAAGTYATTLSNGRTVRTQITDVPSVRDLTRWTLTVDDWQPGRSPTETVHRRHTLTLDGLRAWAEIPELQDVSGVARYTTTVDLGERWDGGAYLELGEVLDTFRVRINGETLPPADQVGAVIDVGRHLRPGTNRIVVDVATTLLNRLRISDPDVYGIAKRQSYGLIGPVRLVPYGEAPIRERGGR